MKRVLASILCGALVLTAFPISASAATPRMRAAVQNNGQISGHATSGGKVLAGYTVQLRNVDTKQLVGSMKTDANGAFSFTGLPVGNYIVEIVDDKGNIVGTVAGLSLVAGAMVLANVGVATSAALAGTAAAVGGGAFLASTTGLVTLVAIGAGTTFAVVATTNNASSSGG